MESVPGYGEKPPPEGYRPEADSRGEGSFAVSVARVARRPPQPALLRCSCQRARKATHATGHFGASVGDPAPARFPLSVVCAVGPPAAAALQVLVGYSTAQAEMALKAIGRNDAAAAIEYLKGCARARLACPCPPASPLPRRV